MSRPLLTALLAAGLLVRLAVLPRRGTTDVNYWKTWTAHAARDLGGVYGVGPAAPVPNVLEWARQRKTVTYPPFAVEELALVGKVHGAWNPEFGDSRSFDAAVKVPGLLAEFAFTAILLTAGRAAFWIADRTAGSARVLAESCRHHSRTAARLPRCAGRRAGDARRVEGV